MGGHGWGMGMEGGECCQTMCQRSENMYCGDSEIFHLDLLYIYTFNIFDISGAPGSSGFGRVVFVW